MSPTCHSIRSTALLVLLGTILQSTAAPIAVSDSLTTPEDAVLNLAAPGLLGNDNAGGLPQISAVLVSPPTKGTVLLNSNGSLSYTPTANTNGADSFTYKCVEAPQPLLMTVDQPASVLTIRADSQTYVTGGTTDTETKTTTVFGDATLLAVPPSSPFGQAQIQKLNLTLAGNVSMTLCASRIFGFCAAEVVASVPANEITITQNYPLEKGQAGPAVPVNTSGSFTQIGNKLDLLGSIALSGSGLAGVIEIPPTVSLNSTDQPYDFTNAQLTQTGNQLRLAVPINLTQAISESGDINAPGAYKVTLTVTGTVYATATIPTLQESAPVAVSLNVTPVDDLPVATADRYYNRQFNTISIPALATPSSRAIIPVKSSWKYATGSDLGTAWRTNTFNDAAWGSVSDIKGYGDTDIPALGTIPARANLAAAAGDTNPNYPTAYFRKTVTITHIFNTLQPRIGLMRDDAAMVWVNGTEVYRDSTRYAANSANPPLASTGEIAYATYAGETIPAADELIYKEITFSRGLLREGANVIAVAIKQVSNASSDLRFDATLTLSEGVSGLLSNDSDIENDPFTSEIWTQPANGRAEVQPNGGFTHAANPSFAGTDSFTYVLRQNGQRITTVSTAVAFGSGWLYLNDNADLGQTWTSPTLDDATWLTGNSPLGYTYADIATTGTVISYGADAASKIPTHYFRKKFTPTVPHDLVSGLRFRLRRDDGAAVWLNGQEIIRSNMNGSVGDGTIGFTTLAASRVNHAAGEYVEYTVSAQHLLPGQNVLAVESHQASLDSSDLVMDLQLSLIHYVYGRVEIVTQPDDADSDGLSDVWELANGFSTTTNDAVADTDRDGRSNYAEFLAGTNPRNATNHLKVNQFKSTAGQLQLDFPSVAGVRYQLQCSDLRPGSTWTNSGAPFLAPATGNFTLPVVPVADCPFYRIRVVPAWQP